MSASQQPALRSLLFHTHDASRPLKPSSFGALSHAIHETLHFALDGDVEDWAAAPSIQAPCGPNEEAEQQEAARSSAEEELTPRPGFAPPVSPSEDDERAYISYQFTEDGTLSLPHPDTIAADRSPDPCAGGSDRDALDVTAKFFLLSRPGTAGGEDRGAAALVEDALRALAASTGIERVDTAILEFPLLRLGELKPSGDEEFVRRTWSALSPSPRIAALGVASASLPSLRVIFDEIPAANGSSHTEASAYRTPSLITIDTGKMRTPCSWDRELKQWCEERGTELGTGNDGDNVLPEETLPTLLAEFADRLPVPLPANARLVPRWCMKYTILIRDRGVLADQSWILRCDVESTA